jgi:hypothetical protein
MLIAALIIMGGVLWGVSSPIIPYQTSSQASADGQIDYYSGVGKNGDVYIWTTDKANPTFYVARHDDFNSSINPGLIMNLKGYVSFVNRSDMINVDTNLAGHIHVSQAHVIEQLTLYDANHHVTGSYSASDYNASSSGYFDNRWLPGGSATILVGLLVACVTLFTRRKKRGQTPDHSDPNWPYTSIAPYPTTESGAQV